jgi:hypothetical protein
MAKTLQQLLSPPQLDAIRAKLLGKLQGRGLATTDWNAFGVERTIVELVAEALQDLVTNTIPTAVGGGFVDYATDDWLTLNSDKRYANKRNAATYTQGTILLQNFSTSPITIQPTSLWFLFPSGNKYNGPIGAGPFTLPAGDGGFNPGILNITVQSESANHSVPTSPDDTAPLVNYVDPSNDIHISITMITPIAGVFARNLAPTYSPVIQIGVNSGAGVGSGNVTPAGTPDGPHTVSVRVDTQGQVGGALVYSYQIDGLDWVTGLTAATQTNIGGHGINFTLANGAGTPSFIQGEVYGFATPGSWITQQGTDQETDDSLSTRDKNKWPSLATLAAIPGSPTLGFYDLLVRQISPQTTQTLVQTDAKVNNKVNIYVAGQGGLLPGSEVARIQASLAALNMLTDRPVALSPTPLAITLAGLTITVLQASLAAAQAALQQALQTFFASLGINASQARGVIRHARIVQIIEDIFGVVDVSDTTMTINGAATSLVLPTVAGQVQLPTWSQAIATAAIWVTT